MSKRLGRVWFVTLLLALLLAAPARAQVTFSNLVESRVGRDPNVASLPANRATVFDQFSLDWYGLYPSLRLGFRYETFLPSDDRALEFSTFTQRYAEWTGEHFDAHVGNFYALFGRGVVLRSFEIPGSTLRSFEGTGIVREESGRQFGDSRDIDGAKLRVHAPRVEAVALAGKPRFADQDPTTVRPGLVSGAMVSVQPLSGLMVGAEYLRRDSPRNRDLQLPPRTSETGGGFAQWSPNALLRHAGVEKLELDTYVEMARVGGLTLTAATSSPKVEPDEGEALYFLQNVFLNDVVPGVRWGLSWEYKNYQNFALGVNEPPTLIREHPYALLNRNTHVTELGQEEGYQFESQMTLFDHGTLILNWSRAENRNSNRFREFYAEVGGEWRGFRLNGFAGDADDGIEAMSDRRVGGVYALAPFAEVHSLEVEFARLNADRRLGNEALPFRDSYVSVTWARAGWFSITGLRQSTDDPFEDGFEDERLTFQALAASVPIGVNHEVIGFWGERRGGLQCTAGTCYRVSPFDGAIVQVISRF